MSSPPSSTCDPTTSSEDRPQLNCFNFYFTLHLFSCAEDVGVVLTEPADSGQTSQSPGELVPVQGAEVGPSQREFPPRTNPLLKHETETQEERSQAAVTTPGGREEGECSTVFTSVQGSSWASGRRSESLLKSR